MMKCWRCEFTVTKPVKMDSFKYCPDCGADLSHEPIPES